MFESIGEPKREEGCLFFL